MIEPLAILAPDASTAPTAGQLIVLFASAACFTAGVALSLMRLLRAATPRRAETYRIWAKGSVYLGVCGAGAVLIWHSARRGSWVPLEDNFDALVCLGMLLAGFVLYIQRRRPVGGLDWF